MLLYGEWAEEEILAPAPHRWYVFTLSNLMRPTSTTATAWASCAPSSAGCSRPPVLGR